MVPIILYYVYICNIYEPIRPGIYWQLVGLLSLSMVTFQTIAHLCSLVSDGNATTLTTITVAIFALFLLLSNCFVRLSRLHYLFRFVSNIAISRFAFEAAILLQYGFGRCGHREVQMFVYSLELDDDRLVTCIQMLIVDLILYRLIAILLLASKANSRENRRQRSERIAMYQQGVQPPKAIIVGLSC